MLKYKDNDVCWQLEQDLKSLDAWYDTEVERLKSLYAAGEKQADERYADALKELDELK